MKKIYFLFFITFILVESLAQNLIFNGSFEEYVFTEGRLQVSTEWSTPFWKDAIFGYCDYYNYLFNIQQPIYGDVINGIPNNGIPNNMMANNRYPRTGNAYAGASLFYLCKFQPINPNCYTGEVFYTPLKHPLTINKCYKVRLYLGATFKNTSFATNSISILFRNQGGAYLLGYTGNDSVVHHCRCEYVPDSSLTESYQPQLTSPRDVFFTDTVGWQKIEFEYMADGTEKYMYIGLLGNPCTDVDVVHYPVCSYEIGQFFSQYIFYDDISVFPCDAPEYPARIKTSKMCVSRGDSVTLGDNHREQYLYWWINSQGDTISNNSRIVVYPTQTDTYILVQKDFKFDETRDTITIHVDPNCTILNDSEFVIYPNPNDGNFVIRFGDIIPDNAKIVVHNAIGKIIKFEPIRGFNNEATINMNVASGLYMVTVLLADGKSISKQLIVLDGL